MNPAGATQVQADDGAGEKIRCKIVNEGLGGTVHPDETIQHGMGGWPVGRQAH